MELLGRGALLLALFAAVYAPIAAMVGVRYDQRLIARGVRWPAVSCAWRCPGRARDGDRATTRFASVAGIRRARCRSRTISSFWSSRRARCCSGCLS
jgi:hypothetical protein